MDKKLRFLILFLFFIFLSSVYSVEKEEILNNFFNQIKDFKSKGLFLRIESIQSDFNFSINFSQKTFDTLNPYFLKIPNKNLTKEISGKGYIKAKFSTQTVEIKPEYFYLFLNSNIGIIVFSQAKNEFQLLIPEMEIIVKDDIEKLKELTKKKERKEIGVSGLPVNFLPSFFDFLIEKESQIKEKIKFLKEYSKDDIKIYSFLYPGENGDFQIDIFDKFWTFSEIKFIGKKKEEIILNFKKPVNETTPYLYLPEKINIKSEKEGDKLNILFSKIIYNKLFSESDLKIKEMNFQEFIGTIYLKILQTKEIK